MENTNTALKIGILKSGMRQYELAAKIGKSESWLSKVLSYRRTPSLDDRRAIAKALKCPMKQLWPDMVGKA